MTGACGEEPLTPRQFIGTIFAKVSGPLKGPFREPGKGSLGKASFGEDELVENIRAFVDAVNQAKPPGAKGSYLLRAPVSSTVGRASGSTSRRRSRGARRARKGGAVLWRQSVTPAKSGGSDRAAGCRQHLYRDPAISGFPVLRGRYACSAAGLVVDLFARACE
jgi:hypothetical protein